MSSAKRIFVGLSGGVDSAVSAALLQRQGHDVTGVFIMIVVDGYPCTAGADRLDAMRVAAHLGIPFKEIDLSGEYKRRVFEESVREFGAGRTPNPDALCNREIKFGLFYDWARKNGADMIATGHYARLKEGLLYAGVDAGKDQSYFLALVPQEVLDNVLFPIGHLRKSEVRALAAQFGLPNAARKDSQGLCFLGPVSMVEMLERELRPSPGAVLDEEGTVIGTHHGAALYTLGQRHGFDIAHSTPASAAQYVIAKDTQANTLTVSLSKFPRAATATQVCLAQPNWIGEAADGAYLARYRYRQELIPARKNGTTVVFDEPHYVPHGQVMVLYKGERCMGGGIIKTAWLSSLPKPMAK